jgi:queuine tRNA-ribosyltransferase
LRKIFDNGALFSSHLDGSKVLFAPENVIEIQCYFGSIISMVLDKCIQYPASYDEAKNAIKLSMR